MLKRAEVHRVAALRNIPQDQQSSLGQFFTPNRAAQLVASIPRLPKSGQLRVLDPGAGSGMLLAALAARALEECLDVSLSLVAVELDSHVMPYLKATLADLKSTVSDCGIKLDYEIKPGDYVELRTGVVDVLSQAEQFDLVIMNPPYRKLSVSSAHRKALSRLGADCPNIYAGFLALGALGLRDGGQLVAITPRSFANGPYFDQFRNFLLDRVNLDRIHVFESRSTVFSDTGVLQENIIFSATRAASPGSVVLSVSHGHTDEIVMRRVEYADVVKPGDSHRFIRLLVDDEDTVTAETMAAMPATLGDIKVEVSTGRVVDFRSRECLLSQPDNESYPLIYPGNVRNGLIEWPRKLKKPQAFAAREPKDQNFLLPQGYYVVVKRFSAKEERRRVVASVWDPSINSGPVAFENHLNIFHRGGEGLPRNLAVGLSYWLNGSVVDRFFRTFSGHTQVNATDLRSLRYPSLEVLEQWGGMLEIALPEQKEIDAKVAAMFELLGGQAGE
ncbi:Eco57I restriction-modification methylase domain-containing protein [Actinoplanes lutulentus]|nr:Eco57I restriction-modification methylase domain-containing protein [Actinoplanes lutulentus]